jgi:peptide-N4-(N-acetyl-beta-glucosaminyl)asparagine amidase
VGDVFLSSPEGLTSSLDYSLIEVLHSVHQSQNEVQSHEEGKKSLVVRHIGERNDSDSKVLAITSRGAIPGILSGTSMYTRQPHQREFIEVYCVQLGGQLAAGDCGSWVVDAETGHLYGHIIAGCPGSGAAMVVPFFLIFQDIECRTNI